MTTTAARHFATLVLQRLLLARAAAWRSGGGAPRVCPSFVLPGPGEGYAPP